MQKKQLTETKLQKEETSKIIQSAKKLQENQSEDSSFASDEINEDSDSSPEQKNEVCLQMKISKFVNLSFVRPRSRVKGNQEKNYKNIS